MVYIQDDCFTIVKEFAGIYSISTDWCNIFKLSVSQLNEFHTENFKGYIKRVYSLKAYNAKLMLIQSMLKQGISKQKWIGLNELLQSKINPVKISSLNLRIGQEVLFENNFVGTITKINKSSIRVSKYSEGEHIVFREEQHIINNTFFINVVYYKQEWNKSSVEYNTLVYKFKTKTSVSANELYKFTYTNEHSLERVMLYELL